LQVEFRGDLEIVGAAVNQRNMDAGQRRDLGVVSQSVALGRREQGGAAMRFENGGKAEHLRRLSLPQLLARHGGCNALLGILALERVDHGQGCDRAAKRAGLGKQFSGKFVIKQGARGILNRNQLRLVFDQAFQTAQNGFTSSVPTNHRGQEIETRSCVLIETFVVLTDYNANGIEQAG
jgi:hypothetical protein